MKKILVTLCLLSFVGVTNDLSAQTAPGKGVLVSGEHLKPGVLPKVRSSDDEVIMFNSNLSENTEGKIGIGNPKSNESMLHLWGGYEQPINQAPVFSLTHVESAKAEDQIINTFNISTEGNTLNFNYSPSGGSGPPYANGIIDFTNLGIKTDAFFNSSSIITSLLTSQTGGGLKINTDHGYVQLGPDNNNWSHFHTDMEKFYFNKSIYVNGEIGSYNNNDLIFKAGHTNDEAMRIKNGSGNVGIGTDNPERNLEIKGQYPAIRLFSEDAQKLVVKWDIIGGDNLTFKRGSAEKLRIDADGNVHAAAFNGDGSNLTGINESNWAENGDDIYYDVGNVGIGLSSPSNSKLHVYRNATMGSLGNINVDNATLKLQDAYNELYIDGNTMFTDGSMVLGTLNDDALCFGTYGTERMKITSGGNVGIGTTNPDCKLTVNGKIKAEEIEVVNDVPQSDYVFEDDYNLKSLEDVERFVKENKHLPEVPSADEFKENGYKVGQMDDLLLRKVEELTLYIIELKKENTKLNNRVNELEMLNQ